MSALCKAFVAHIVYIYKENETCTLNEGLYSPLLHSFPSKSGVITGLVPSFPGPKRSVRPILLYLNKA